MRISVYTDGPFSLEQKEYGNQGCSSETFMVNGELMVHSL